MDLFELDDLINNLSLYPTNEEIEQIYRIFKRDFVESALIIDGLRVKVVMKQSKVEGFENYSETFIHLITRKSRTGKRVFDRLRANKIHWIRCILENRKAEEVIYFQYPHSKGRLRDYFWYREGRFVVIMEKITPNYLIVTSFCIDDNRNEKYFEKRCQWYLKNRT